jgi:hypothetical protein
MLGDGSRLVQRDPEAALAKLTATTFCNFSTAGSGLITHRGKMPRCVAAAGILLTKRVAILQSDYPPWARWLPLFLNH